MQVGVVVEELLLLTVEVQGGLVVVVIQTILQVLADLIRLVLSILEVAVAVDRAMAQVMVLLVDLVVSFSNIIKMFVLLIPQDLFDLQIAAHGLFQKDATRLIISLLLAVEVVVVHQHQHQQEVVAAELVVY